MDREIIYNKLVEIANNLARKGIIISGDNELYDCLEEDISHSVFLTLKDCDENGIDVVTKDDINIQIYNYNFEANFYRALVNYYKNFPVIPGYSLKNHFIDYLSLYLEIAEQLKPKETEEYNKEILIQVMYDNEELLREYTEQLQSLNNDEEKIINRLKEILSIESRKLLNQLLDLGIIYGEADTDIISKPVSKNLS